MDWSQALFFAVLQGATELFPVSSLGHAVVVPAVLRWGVDQRAAGFLPFLVMLHLGTALGLLVYFWRDWAGMARGVVGGGARGLVARKLLARLIVATLPAIIIGVVVEGPVRRLFARPMTACLFLICNAGLLALGERLRARGIRRADTLSYGDALIVGLFQCLAFLPGISRSGAAIVGALRRGVPHEEAARFSFLMGTPVILAAAAVEVPKLARTHELHALFGISAVAAVAAGVVAFASTAFLMRYFRDHDAWALLPFAWYCLVAGIGGFALLAAGL